MGTSIDESQIFEFINRIKDFNIDKIRRKEDEKGNLDFSFNQSLILEDRTKQTDENTSDDDDLRRKTHLDQKKRSQLPARDAIHD